MGVSIAMAEDVDPIPMAVLVDSIDVTEHHSATTFDSNPEPAVHHFSHVLVQPVTKEQINGGSGESAMLQHIGDTLVFIDARNSVNTDSYTIKLGDRVTYGDQTRQVIQVSPMKALLRTPHHWEVLLQ